MAAIAVCILSGCVTSTKFHMVKEGMLPAVPLDYTAEIPGLELKLVAVIINQGPGSWKADARWDEYVVRLTNRSPEALSVESVVLVDVLSEKQLPGVDAWALERLSENNWDKYAKAGLYVLGAGAAHYSLTVGTFALLMGASTGFLVMVPAALVTNAFVVAGRNRKNKRDVQMEFDWRRFRLPSFIAPGATVAGSFFFPVAPAPQRLILQVRVGEANQELVLDLKPLAGLHVKPAEQ